jgi:hypothetical protein
LGLLSQAIDDYVSPGNIPTLSPELIAVNIAAP